MSYDLVRALHIISVIAWMAGMLMLPRLYAYQTGAVPGGELEQKMIAASKALRNIILTPSMILAWVFGLHLFATYIIGDWSVGFFPALAHTPHWFWAKFALVLALSGYHGFLVSAGKKLAKGERPYSEKFWRMTNEIPFLIAIAIVLLVTLEPF
ncbi:MAG: CopD family protein [Caulobacterales bacterium]